MFRRLFIALCLIVIASSAGAQTYRSRVVTDRWGVTHAFGLGPDHEQF